MSIITIGWPDDFYLRLGQTLDTLKYTAGVFGRALFMPHQDTPIRSSHEVRKFQKRIHESSPGRSFTPLMVLDILPGMHWWTVRRAFKALGPNIVAGTIRSTTEADNMLGDLTAFEATLKTLEKHNMVLCLRCEPPNVFHPEREEKFLDAVRYISEEHPGLRILLQGVRTWRAVARVFALENLAATITAPDLFAAMRMGPEPRKPYSLRPTIEEEEANFKAIRYAVMSGGQGVRVLTPPRGYKEIRLSRRFFFGTQSTHAGWNTETYLPGVADVFSSRTAISIVTSFFDTCGGSEKDLNDFVAVSGARFFGLQPNKGAVRLVERPWQVPHEISGLIPLGAGLTFPWQVESVPS
jgi:dihydroorotase